MAKKDLPKGWKHNKSSELKKGIKAEKEHIETAKKLYSQKIKPEEAAKSIAKEHLKEDPNYYSKLEKVEGKKFAKGGSLAVTNDIVNVGDNVIIERRAGDKQVTITNITDKWVIFEEDGKRKDLAVDKFKTSYKGKASSTIQTTQTQKTEPLKFEDLKVGDYFELKGVDWVWGKIIKITTIVIKAVNNRGKDLDYLVRDFKGWVNDGDVKVIPEPTITTQIQTTKPLELKDLKVGDYITSSNWVEGSWNVITKIDEKNVTAIDNDGEISNLSKEGLERGLKLGIIKVIPDPTISQTTKQQEKAIPSTDPSTWDAKFNIGDNVKIRVDMAKGLYESSENNYVIKQIDSGGATPYKLDNKGNNIGGFQRPENPSGILYILNNNQSWEGKDLELIKTNVIIRVQEDFYVRNVLWDKDDWVKIIKTENGKKIGVDSKGKPWEMSSNGLFNELSNGTYEKIEDPTKKTINNIQNKLINPYKKNYTENNLDLKKYIKLNPIIEENIVLAQTISDWLNCIDKKIPAYRYTEEGDILYNRFVIKEANFSYNFLDKKNVISYETLLNKNLPVKNYCVSKDGVTKLQNIPLYWVFDEIRNKKVSLITPKQLPTAFTGRDDEGWYLRTEPNYDYNITFDKDFDLQITKEDFVRLLEETGLQLEDYFIVDTTNLREEVTKFIENKPSLIEQYQKTFSYPCQIVSINKNKNGTPVVIYNCPGKENIRNNNFLITIDDLFGLFKIGAAKFIPSPKFDYGNSPYMFYDISGKFDRYSLNQVIIAKLYNNVTGKWEYQLSDGGIAEDELLYHYSTEIYFYNYIKSVLDSSYNAKTITKEDYDYAIKFLGNIEKGEDNLKLKRILTYFTDKAVIYRDKDTKKPNYEDFAHYFIRFIKDNKTTTFKEKFSINDTVLNMGAGSSSFIGKITTEFGPLYRITYSGSSQEDSQFFCAEQLLLLSSAIEKPVEPTLPIVTKKESKLEIAKETEKSLNNWVAVNMENPIELDFEKFSQKILFEFGLKLKQVEPEKGEDVLAKVTNYFENK